MPSKGSKGSKRAWGKADIGEVEEYPVAKQDHLELVPTADLFSIDKAGNYAGAAHSKRLGVSKKRKPDGDAEDSSKKLKAASGAAAAPEAVDEADDEEVKAPAKKPAAARAPAPDVDSDDEPIVPAPKKPAEVSFAPKKSKKVEKIKEEKKMRALLQQAGIEPAPAASKATPASAAMAAAAPVSATRDEQWRHKKPEVTVVPAKPEVPHATVAGGKRPKLAKEVAVASMSGLGTPGINTMSAKRGTVAAAIDEAKKARAEKEQQEKDKAQKKKGKKASAKAGAATAAAGGATADGAAAAEKEGDNVSMEEDSKKKKKKKSAARLEKEAKQKAEKKAQKEAEEKKAAAGESKRGGDGADGGMDEGEDNSASAVAGRKRALARMAAREAELAARQAAKAAAKAASLARKEAKAAKAKAAKGDATAAAAANGEAKKAEGAEEKKEAEEGSDGEGDSESDGEGDDEESHARRGKFGRRKAARLAKQAEEMALLKQQDEERKRKAEASEAKRLAKLAAIRPHFERDGPKSQQAVLDDPVAEAARKKLNREKRLASKQAEREQRKLDAEKRAAARQSHLLSDNTEIVDIWGNDYAEAKSAAEAAKIERGFKVAFDRERDNTPHRGSRDDKKAKSHLGSAALKVALPGQSFNPDEEARQAVIKKAFERDEAERKERERITNKLNGKFDATPSPKLLEGYNSDDETERPAESRVVVVKKLSKTERNRLERKRVHSEQERERLLQKEMRKQIHEIPVILQQLKEQKEAKIKHDEEVAKKKLENPVPIKLSKHDYEAPFPEVLLSDELGTGSLRELKASPFAVAEQFNLFQSKNLIDVRKPVKARRRYALKEYEKHKDGVRTDHFRKPKNK